MSRSGLVYIEAGDVLEQVDDDELLDELHRRRREVHTGPHIMQIYESMAMGNRERTWELMREYVQNVTGRLLP